jgi:aspartate racemase
MKTIGLIGGTTWLSTIDYYRNINQMINRRLGGVSSAKIILYSVNFDEFQPPALLAEWEPITDSFIHIARTLETAGADCIIICANTPHLFAGKIQASVQVPLIHIAEATAKKIKLQQLKKVALLGTRITMEQDFFREKLNAQGIETIIPGKEDIAFIHNSIFAELGHDIFLPETKQRYLRIINDLMYQGAEGVILGCTEIPLLIKPPDLECPVFDTVMIHSEAAVEFALA